MKLSLFKNVLLIAMVSVVAVSCGKDSKKKSNSSNYQCYNGTQNCFYNPFVQGQQPSNYGTAARTALESYLNGNENRTNLVGPVNVTISRYSCKSKEFLGINFLPYESCSYSQLNSTRYAQPGVARVSQNPELLKVLNPDSGYTLGNIVQYGSVFVVDHTISTGTGIETKQYVVDSNRHSVTNPSTIKDTATKTIDSVVYPQI